MGKRAVGGPSQPLPALMADHDAERVRSAAAKKRAEARFGAVRSVVGFGVILPQASHFAHGRIA